MAMYYSNPQVAQDIPKAIDAVITYASRAGEHMGVMQKNMEKHDLEMNTGEIWHGGHVAKINAFHGGPRTHFTQAARHSVEPFDVHLGYTVSILAIARDQGYLLNKRVLRQMGAQQGEAITRDVDRRTLGAFSTASVSTDRSGNPILANSVLDAIFKLDAAEDDTDSPIKVVSPVAHIQDLVHERTTTSLNSAVIVRPLTDDAAMMLKSDSEVEIRGRRVQQARNAPKYGSDGWTGVYRMTGFKYVTGPALQRETQNEPFFGGGAQRTIVRKFWGFSIPPHSYRNWFIGIKAQMPIGGK